MMNTQAKTVPVQPERRIRIVGAAAAALTILCLLSAGKRLGSFLSGFFGGYQADFGLLPDFVDQLIRFAFMTVFLFLFVRIAASGRPFTKPNVLILKIAAIILIFSLILPPLCSIAVSAAMHKSQNLFYESVMTLLGSLNIYSICEILLAALCREIVYYGTMLQTESDETL